jgi:hypothetical protein
LKIDQHINRDAAASSPLTTAAIGEAGERDQTNGPARSAHPRTPVGLPKGDSPDARSLTQHL